MPSEDRIDPKTNAWMENETVWTGNETVTTGAASSVKREKKPVRSMAAVVQRIARRVGVSPDTLAEKIPADTVRRLQYPVLEQVAEDGSRTFEHDTGIKEGPISLPRL